MRHAALLVVVAVAASCAMPPSTAPAPVRDYPVPAPPERVWAALMQVYTDLDIPIENMERASWFLRSGEMRVDIGQPLAGERTQDVLDCGTAMGFAVAETSPVHISITTLLRPIGTDSTGVRTSVRAVAITRGMASPTAQCVSKGILERLIAEALAQRAGAVS